MPEMLFEDWHEQANLMLKALIRQQPCISDVLQNGEAAQLYRIISDVNRIAFNERINYAMHLDELSTDQRAALACLGSLMIADLYEGAWNDITAMFCRGHDIRIPSAVSFAGWGLNNSTGPSYQIRSECFAPDTCLFYTDDDMVHDEHEARARLAALQLYSTGLTDFQLEKVTILGTVTTVQTGYQNAWVITFCADNGTLIVPKAGEYDLFIGAILPDAFGPGRSSGLLYECKHYCLK